MTATLKKFKISGALALLLSVFCLCISISEKTLASTNAEGGLINKNFTAINDFNNDFLKYPITENSKASNVSEISCNTGTEALNPVCIPPSAPALTGPVNNGYAQPGEYCHFAWNDPLSGTGPFTYTLYVYNPVYSTWSNWNTGSNTSYDLLFPEYFGQLNWCGSSIQWYVIVTNSCGTATSATNTFTLFPLYPGSPADFTITPTLNCQTSGGYIGPGEVAYYAFNATAGNLYYFTTCNTIGGLTCGGSTNFDTYISLYGNNASCVKKAYNDDGCSLQSYISWICPVTGNYLLAIEGFNDSEYGIYNLQYRVSCPYLIANMTGGSSPVCYNSSSATFNISTSGGDGIYNYQWYRNGNPVGSNTSSYTAGAITGTTTIYCMVTSCGQNVTTSSYTIYLEASAPMLICPGTQSLNLNSNCQAVMPDYTVLALATDNCGSLSLIQTPATGTTINGPGSTLVLLTATDGSGNASSCNFTLNKNDISAPAILCPNNITTYTNTGCTATAVLTGVPVTSDNCGSVTVTNNHSSTTYNLGTTVVLWKVTDNSGNSATCNQTVTVIDNVSPVITCPGPVTTYTNSGCEAMGVSIGTSVTIDNCGVATVTNDHPSSTFAIGTTTVTWTVTDFAGNSAVCQQVINVIDNVSPTVICPSDIFLNNTPGQCGAVANFAATANDNCSGVFALVITYSIQPGSFFPVGSTLVTVIANDGATPAMNTSTCTFSVTVADAELPVMDCSLSRTIVTNDPDICGAIVDYLPVIASDNCGIQNITYSQNSGTFFPVGTTDITAIVTDVHSNSSSCTFSVIVNDEQPPAALCNDLVVYLDPVTSAGSITVAQADNGSYDNCGIDAMILSKYNFSCSDVGFNNIGLTVIDNYGNSSVCNFQAQVIDSLLPVITHCPAYPIVYTDPGLCTHQVLASDLLEPAFTDNCPGATIINNYNGLSTLVNSVLPKGPTPITWKVVDVSGNSAECSYILNVQDEEPPQITCIGNLMVNMDWNKCSYEVAGSILDPANIWDNCTDYHTLNNFNNDETLDGAIFQGGPTVVVWAVTDASFNVDTCSFSVTVIDNQPPVISCPDDAMKSTDHGKCYYTGQIGEFDPYMNDNCNQYYATSNLGTTGSLSGYQFPKGQTNVIWTVHDAGGNTTYCDFTVTVNDNEPPAISCPPNQVKPTDELLCNYTSNGNEFQPAFSDNCPGALISNTYNAQASLNGAVFSQGTGTVTWQVVDANNNTNTCSFVIVVNDYEIPEISCPHDTTFCNQMGNFQVTSMHYNVWDNCGVQSVITDQPAVFPLGITTVLWTVTDIHNNTNTCTQMINYSSGMEVSISQGSLPVFCQGEGMQLTAQVSGNNNVTYLWSTGETAQSIQVNAAGIYTVTATDPMGCKADESTIVAYASDELLSSYVILVRKDIDLDGVIVNDLGIGSKGADGKIKVKHQSQITDAGTFARAIKVEVDNSSTVTNIIHTPVNVPWPAFQAMPYHGNINAHVSNNSVMYLTDTLYKEVKIGKNATAIFTRAVVNVEKKIKIEEGATVRFATCATVRIKDKFETGKNVTINPDDVSVRFYIDHDVNFDEGNRVTGVFYLGDRNSHDTTKHHIKIKQSKISRPGIYKVLLLAEKVTVEKNNQIFAVPYCNFCNPQIPKDLGASDEQDYTEIVSEPEISVYPDPFNNATSFTFSVPEDDHVKLEVYDISGKLIQILFDAAVSGNTPNTIRFDGNNLPSGIYIYRLTTSDKVLTGKMIRSRE